MEASVLWFAGTVATGVIAGVVGMRLGRGDAPRAWRAVAAAATLLGLWAWLAWNPAVAVQAIPVRLLSRIEGVAAAPLFMLILGVAWARSARPRQRAVVTAAALVGVIYVLRGGGWMIQPTPAEAFTRTIDREMVAQSQDYSCVAAASATALTRLGLLTSEAEMARLTRTTPGNGATLVRAMDGITQRLRGTPWRVELLQPTLDQLMVLPTPMLATVQVGPLQRHMIVVEAATPRHVRVLDPAGGPMVLTTDEFARTFTGVVLIFRR
jgi:predicted double-glycine peptidase